jgi:hypothetical protein
VLVAVRQSTISALDSSVRVHIPIGNAVNIQIQGATGIDQSHRLAAQGCAKLTPHRNDVEKIGGSWPLHNDPGIAMTNVRI